MTKRTTTYSVICILAIILIHSTATAQWTDYWGFTIGDVGASTEPAFVADGAGGVIVTWVSEANGNNDIYAQRLDDHGLPLWTTAGVPVCTNGASQTDPRIAADGAGGVFITWQDDRDSGYGVYGQRLSTYGFAQWAPDGIPIAWEAATQANHETAADGFGGLVVVWEQFQIPYYQIRAQRVGADGTLLWGGSVTAASTAGHLRFPELAILPGPTEADTRLTVAWTDYRDSGTNGSDIYAQRLTLGGVVQWAPAGVVVYAGLGDQLYPDLIASNSAGTIFTWRDLRDSDDRGFCQKFDRYGNILWGGAGQLLTWTAYYDEAGPKMVSNGTYGAFIACGSSLYHLDQNGNTLWGRSLYTGGSQGAYNACPVRLDDRSCVVFYHKYAVAPDPLSVLGNRFEEDTGDAMWGVYGVTLTDYAYAGSPPHVLVSGDGVFATWTFTYWAWAISVQRFDLDEVYWGYPRPVITAIEDVPQDEGGWLTMNVRATSNDQETINEEIATGYNVWRRVPPRAAANDASTEEALAVISTQKTIGLRVADAAAIALGLPSGEWESLGFHAAMQEPYYDFVVPTRTDATDGSEPYEAYVVTAHTTSPTVHFTSWADSAYSVDNLAPGLLQGLTAEAEYDPVGLDLSWHALTTSDLANYVIHRGTDGTFVPDESNLMASPTATTWLDVEWTAAAGFHYKVAGVDRHLNVGGFAAVSDADASGVDTGLILGGFVLGQNHPNPFNPQTTISFNLPQQAAVTLRVFDVAGHLVKVLLDDEIVAEGRNEAVWYGRDGAGRRVASGTYFYRLEAGTYSETKRMVLVM